MQELKFELIVDGIPYLIKAIPFDFNSEKRFRVSYNGGNENIFAWDSEILHLRAIDNDAASLPGNLEIAIAEKLEK